MRILLADDQPSVRLALRLVLRYRWDMQLVGEATDSETLATVLDAAQADLLLLDWGIFGREAAEALPALRARYPALKVIVMSGQFGARRAALAAGADAFVSKGEPPDRLWTALKEVGGNTK